MQDVTPNLEIPAERTSSRYREHGLCALPFLREPLIETSSSKRKNLMHGRISPAFGKRYWTSVFKFDRLGFVIVSDTQSARLVMVRKSSYASRFTLSFSRLL